jgi:hypothetical protein
MGMTKFWLAGNDAMGFRKDILTYVIVTAVTLLIWVWAATETREQQTFSVRVEFIVPDPDEWLIEPAQRTTTITVQGSRLSLDTMQERVRRPLQVEVLPRPGTQPIDLLAAIRENPAIEETGVNVMSADPFSVELRIDEMIREQARVRPYLPRVQTIGEVQVDPEQVTVTIPRGMRQQLPAELIVEPVIDQQRLDRLEPEVRQPMEISLRLADGTATGDRIRIDPPRAQFTFAVRSRIRELALDSVRVQLAGPPEDHHDYLVEVEDSVLRDVTIRADSNLIDRIEQREALVVAMLHVSSREKEQQITAKPISYFVALYTDASGLTHGRIVEAEVAGSADLPLIRLRIERKDAG